MSAFWHGYAFDPAYGYSKEALLQIGAPEEPPGFSDYWLRRHERVRLLSADPTVQPVESIHPEWDEFQLTFRTSDDLNLGGWLLTPKHQPVTRGFIVAHGYGGRQAPDHDLGLEGAALMFPCSRGLGLSRGGNIPENPDKHVVHGLPHRDGYVIGGCVEDVWMSVTALLELFPQAEGRTGFVGTSFSGGVGALAMAWEDRLQRGVLKVPSFGHHRLRLGCSTTGSTRALAKYAARHPAVWQDLPFFDAAVAARHIRQPVLVAAALFDPVVPPPAQFAIHNSLGSTGTLFALTAGHFDHPGKDDEEARLRAAVTSHFLPL
ncbi:MAG: acetylxylan esterase [Verrucomicrobiales bacterium]|nr:acetylxylan esterase [Verrucomicrobiales bacterium]